MTERETKQRKVVAQFCHAIGNMVQPEQLLVVAQHLKEVQEGIDLRDNIIKGLLVASESVGIIDPDDENIKAIKLLIHYKEEHEG